MDEGSRRSIGEVVTQLAEEFPDVSISKLRFLEAQGLVTPERAPSGYRRYRDRDIAQVRWILRQQRDHFMPLRVLRERLSAGDLTDEELASEAAAAAPARVDALRAPDDDIELTGQEVAERTGLRVEQLAAMEKAGLVTPRQRRGRPVYSGDDLIAARLVARFLAHGIEPRHLKAVRVAAEREAGLIQQRLSGVSGDAAIEDTKRDLIHLGEDLRALLLRRLI
ncbi:MAG: MerR family transcriptional regulator [Actinomycetota bacterium]